MDVALLVVWLSLAGAAPAQFDASPFGVEARPAADGAVDVVFTIPPGHRIYADTLEHLGDKSWGRGACTDHADMRAISCSAVPPLKPNSCDGECGGDCPNGFCECGTKKCMCHE